MSNLYSYMCHTCFKRFDKLDDLSRHQVAVHGQAAYIDARDPMQRLEGRIVALEEQIRRLALEIEAMNTDPNTVRLVFPPRG